MNALIVVEFTTVALRGLSFMLPPVLKDTRVPGATKLNPLMIMVVVEAPALTEGGDKLATIGGRLTLAAPEVKLAGSGFADASKTWLAGLKVSAEAPVGAFAAVAKVIFAISRGPAWNTWPPVFCTSIPILPPPGLGLNEASVASPPGAALTKLKIEESKFNVKLTWFSSPCELSTTETTTFPPAHAVALVALTVRP